MNCLQYVYTLVNTRKDDVARAYALVGGCEGWLQVELNMAYLRQNIQAKREQQVYTNNLDWNADLLVPFNNGDHVVELKCESLGQTQHGGYNFTIAFLNDMEKMKTATFKQNVTQGILRECQYARTGCAELNDRYLLLDIEGDERQVEVHEQ
ncbi:hypothetical protein MMC11_008687 [Xylographa trunciseda]|nr:hypothetical protein [Xylographa trunciseda]